MTRARNGAASAAPARARYVADPAEGRPGYAWLLDTVTGSRNHLLPVAEVERLARQRNTGSGTSLTEAQRAATCERTEQIKVRVRPGYRARLRALSEHDGWSMGAWVETMIEESERELRALKAR